MLSGALLHSTGKENGGRCINFVHLAQVIFVENRAKIKVENLDGKTRDERETCFPVLRVESKMKGAGLR